jgi:RNA polymerase sigma-70 factor (ECF subfamily)
MSHKPPTADSSADAGLLRRIALGDSGALKTLHDRCSGRALAVAQRMLRSRSDAEEVVQEAFLQIWKRAETYDPARGGVDAWVATIVRTRAVDRLRALGANAKMLASNEAAVDVGAPEVPSPSHQLESAQDRARVNAALKELSPEQRSVLELAFFEGLSHREIAERTGQPLGTVKTRVRLGMLKLAGVLED